MLTLDRGAAMARIVSSIEDLGWRWAYRTVDAICAVPQRRRRVLLVASPVHDPRTVLFADDHPTIDDRTWTEGEASGFFWTEGRNGAGLRHEAVPTIKVGSGLGIRSAPAILKGDGRMGMPSIGDAERLQGLPEGWTGGVPERDRWRLVGNAVPPPLAAWVAGRIAETDMSGAAVRAVTLDSRNGWPSAAFGDIGGRWKAFIGESFAGGERPRLSDVMREPLIPLSPRAVAGFLKRARGGVIRWPGRFLEAVERAG